MNRTLLWAQNEEPSIPPTILVDGGAVLDETAQDAFNRLNEANQHLELSPETREKFQKKCEKKGIFFSRQANYKVLPNNSGVYIQGCYLDEDKAGRKMPFMFLLEGSNSLEEAVNRLKEDSRKLNRTCNEDELKRLSLYNAKSKTKKRNYFSFLGIIILIAILWCILSQTS